MKRILLGLLVILAAACSSEDGPDVSGVYRAESLDLVAVMRIEGGSCASFDVWIKGEAAGSWSAVSTAGKYPNYSYQVDGLNVRARFLNIDSFDATLDGVLRRGSAEGLALDRVYTSFDGVKVRFSKFSANDFSNKLNY